MPADDVLPYPGRVLGIINAVAWLGPVIGILGGIALIYTVGTTPEPEFGSNDTQTGISMVIGIALVVGSSIHWAFSRAAALVVEYLWKIQARV